jgi:hypothetical protein
MPYYWVRNKRGQVAAEVSETGLSVHDQGLSWQLHRLKEKGDFPFSGAGASKVSVWNLDDLLRFLEENGYTAERHDD